MNSPRMYTTADEIKVIRRRLNEHSWYAEALENLRKPCDEFLKRGINIPKEKGFVFYETCPKDNTRLYQNPFEPDNIYCPTCGTKYTEEPYYRAWVWFYHLNLAQRARDMGIIYQVTRDEAYANAIRYILNFYAENYEQYPLFDNVLGPTRLFQSTYQEGLWIESLAGAADLVREQIPNDEFRSLVRNLFIPSAEVIKDYDEKRNNRQVMNNGGLGAVGILCEDDGLLNYALYGPHGFMWHLEHSVLEDGLWYEGDNYHFASLPSMTNLADAMARAGVDLFRIKAGQRTLKMMYDAPMFALYPDLTFPARKDSQYASAANQRWYAGLYELAYNRYRDPAYGKLLRAMYAGPKEEGTQLRSAAGAIDIQQPKYAGRNLMDWRGFLNAVPDLGDEVGLPVTKSLNMTGTGLSVLRQDGGRTYASLDYGNYGGGHGHPDRMQLNFYARGHRWLTDWGTGNYFLPHLAWYRSSVGHNTVVVDGRTQLPVDGFSRRFGATPGAQLAAGGVDEIYPGVRFRRTAVLLSSDVLLDLFEVQADQSHQLDWILHPHGEMMVEGADAPFAPAEIAGEHYEWLNNVAKAPASGSWSAYCHHEGDVLGVHMLGAEPTEVYTAGAYGAPNRIPNLFPLLLARRQAAQTTYATLLEHRPGGKETIHAFRQTAEGRYEVLLVSGERLLVSYDPATAAVTVVRYDAAGVLAEASGFGVAAVAGAFEADFPLDQVYLKVEGTSATLTVPERFGRIRVAAPGVERVAVNGGAPAPYAGDVRQASGAWAELAADRVFAGMPNTLAVTIYNYTSEALAGDLGVGLPAGWSLTAPAPLVAVPPLSVGTCTLTVNPGADPGEVTLALTGDRLDVKPAAPVSLEAWFPNLQGSVLRVQVTNLTGEQREVDLTVAGVTKRCVVDRSTVVDFPVSWQDGPFSLQVQAACGGYVTARTVSTRVAFPGHEYTMAEAGMIRRAERHWGGPSDLSARFRIDREGDLFKVAIRVTDNHVKCSGSAEKHFDYDSVQIYFDPRPDRERKNGFLTGVYGLVLVPASRDGQGPRIYPIGPVESTLMSKGMSSPALDGVKLESALRDDGYDLMLELPVARLGCELRPGDKLGFDLIVNDNDGTYRRELQMIWTGCDGYRIWLRQDYHAPQQMGVLLI